MTINPTLTPEQWNILQALMNRIIPADDFPDAWEAGVGDYMARQFEGDLHSQVATYQLGLDSLNAESLSHAGEDFVKLSSSIQDEILSNIENGRVESTWVVDPSKFFSAVIEHVMEGYYSDPANGGNRDSIAWQMIGFESRE